MTNISGNSENENGPAPNRAADSAALWRILDAAANRASEGLRVVEDYARLGLDDRHLSTQLKELRHRFAELLKQLPTDQRLAGRDTLADVGTSISTAGEQSRENLTGVVIAGWKRIQQSLRTLEEYGKLVSGEFASSCEQLRYQTYTLERALDITQASRERLEQARLYVLLSARDSEAGFGQLVESLVTAGVHIIQLREKNLADKELLARAKILRQLTLGTETLFVMNDRPDLALLTGADGVHVGQEELSVKEVRAVVGTKLLVGVSTHSIEQARAAVLSGANYIGIGPTFPSTTKQFEAFPGLEFARAVAAEVTLPGFAIGGINAENLAEVQAAGIPRVAVGAAITEAKDPVAAAKRMLEQLH